MRKALFIYPTILLGDFLVERHQLEACLCQKHEHVIEQYPAKKQDTVDGQNPAPVEVGSLSHDFQGFSTIPGGCLGFPPATVSLATDCRGS